MAVVRSSVPFADFILHHSSPGVFIIAQTMSVRIAIEELLLLCLALWESRGLTAYGHRGPACAAGLCCDRFYAARLAMGLLVQKLRE